MKHFQFLLILSMLFSATHVMSEDNNAVGVWQTESTDRGYLHVSIEKCASFLCGTILQAYDLEGVASADYEHAGKSMIWDMKSSGTSTWKGGKIWDPTSDKTYKSKMSVEDDTLSVSGCILFICKAQKWMRVQ